MCGIAGYFNKNRNSNNFKKIVSMIALEQHRGPDDQGFFGIDFLNKSGNEIRLEEKTYLKEYDGYFGFCRLSIRDLSMNGHQPMFDLDNKIVLVFNGEIYNADTYRDELKRKGYLFHSTTDTEVVLNLYKEYGFDYTIMQLNGMFAIAIADFGNRKVYMARDRFGIKPFYYIDTEDAFLFASEIKCFLPLAEFDRELNVDALQEIIIYGTNHKNCLFKEVNEVQPGEIIEWDMTKPLEKRKYFDIGLMRHPKKAKKPYPEYQKELKNLLTKVVKSQMASDVRIACQLSGGVDSSVISLIANDFGTNNLKDSVSITFGEKHSKYNEKEYIDIVNRKLNLIPHTGVIDQRYYMDNLKKAIWYLDTIPVFCNEMGILKLAETIAPYSTVLLSGEGADEVFGGYYKFVVGKILSSYCKLPFKPGQKKFSKKYFMSRAIENDNFVLGGYGATVEEKLAQKIFVDNRWEKIFKKRQEILREIEGDGFEKQQKYDILTRLPGLLNRQDKMTMAYSLENRVPFLDNEILEYSYTIPEKYLIGITLSNIGKKGISILQGKYILKKLSSDIFGKRFSYRKKMGFDIPIRDYLQDDNFKEDFYNEILPGMKKRSIINTDVIKQWYEDIQIITDKELIALWRCILTELWCGIFLDNRKVHL